MEPSMIVVLGGILPFGSIFIEMYACYRIVCFLSLPVFYSVFLPWSFFWHVSGIAFQFI